MRARYAAIDETITCVATSSWGVTAKGRSGDQAHNIGVLNQIGSGNFGKGGFKDSRGARLFRNVVDRAGRENLGGKRSPFSCAEVSAVVALLQKGVDLNVIEVKVAKGSDGREVERCPSCKQWIEELGL